LRVLNRSLLIEGYNDPMVNGDEKDIMSYRDPQGDRIQAARTAREQKLSRFPSVDSVYQGFYIRFEPDSAQGRRALAGSEGIVGSRLTAILTERDRLGESNTKQAGEPEADQPKIPAEELGVELKALSGTSLIALNGQDAERIKAAILAGWSVNIHLSLIVFSKQMDGFWAEAACILFNREQEAALKQFTKNIVYRISSGTHPGLTLNQEQFVRVMESNGAWYLTKDTPLPTLQQGEIFYKRRKVWSEYLVEAATSGKIGCKIAAILFWLIVIIAAIWLVVRFIF